MSNSKRHVSLQTLREMNWQSIFDDDKEKRSLTFCENSCFELALTHRDLRPMPSTDPEDHCKIWDSGPMIPHYFDVEMMKQELVRLSAGTPSTAMVPLTEVGGIGGSCSARMAVHDEWLQLILLPMDWMLEKKRELEVRWIAGKEKRIKNRYRLRDTPRQLAGQMPAGYWGHDHLVSTKLVLTISYPFFVQIILYKAEAHVEDEHGVAGDSVTVKGIVSQLENGIVLWWYGLSQGAPEPQITLKGEYIIIGDSDKLIHIFTGAGSS